MKKLNKFLILMSMVSALLINVNVNAETSITKTEFKTASLYLSNVDNLSTKTLSATANTYAATVADTLAIKEAIYKGLVSFQQTIDLSAFAGVIDDPQIPLDLYLAIYKSSPDLFYIQNTVNCSYSIDSFGKIHTYYLNVGYLYDIATCKVMKQKLDAKVKYIKENYLDLASSEIQKEYAIHDYIIENCSYDVQALSSTNVSMISHTAYGALVNGVAVCDGYAKAGSLLFKQCGIESSIISSSSMNHAWNLVKIGGSYFNLDLTWDDPSPESNKTRYTYFNCSDSELAKDHKWTPSTTTPATSSKFSFLRNYTNIARIEDSICYKVGNTLSYMDLYGGSVTNELASFVTNDFVGDRKNIYYINGTAVDGRTANCVMKYNIVNNSSKTLFKTAGTINDIYKNANGIVVKYTLNNVAQTTILSTKLDEDITRDGIIDIKDLATIASKYNVTTTNTSYKALIDFNKDGIIDIFDIVKITCKL